LLLSGSIVSLTASFGNSIGIDDDQNDFEAGFINAMRNRRLLETIMYQFWY